jgi:hypothetical protein
VNALRNSIVQGACLALLAWWSAGCGSPLVGLECRDGLESCGSACYDLTSDNEHCGRCDNACSTGTQCQQGVCSAAPPGDGGPDAGDARVDASADAGDGAIDIDARADGGDGAVDIDARSEAGFDIDASTDGALTLPDGAIVLPDGAIQLPDGAIVGVDDGGLDDAAIDTDGEVVVVPPVECTGPGSPTDCVCGLGLRRCGLSCINVLTDHDHCGDCDTVCRADEYCSAGLCDFVCTPPLKLCGGQCADLESDDLNCGDCGLACGSAAACIEGECIGEAVGHIVTVGHDMSVVTRPIRQIVANAVFLSPRTPVRVLAYDATTSVASRVGVSLAIQQGSTTIGRAYTLTTASPELVTEQLADTDVFVIEVQQGATNQELADLGAAWSVALHTFLFRGGVILLFDGSGANDGTYQVLKYATEAAVPLLDVSARFPIPQRILSLVTASDAIAAGVSTEYQSQGATVGFQVSAAAANPGVVVIRDALPGVDGGSPPTGLPIVIHATTAQ